MNWTEMGNGVHGAKTPKGWFHVMQHNARNYTLTLNGRLIGSARTLDDAKGLAR